VGVSSELSQRFEVSRLRKNHFYNFILIYAYIQNFVTAFRYENMHRLRQNFSVIGICLKFCLITFGEDLISSSQDILNLK